MKRTLALLAAVSLSASLAGTSVAAVKKPAPPKPVKLTYYFHGTNAVGNVDQNVANGTLMTMNASKPTGSSDKTFGIFGAGATPNPDCAGSPFYPNWVGAANGTATGTATVSFYAAGTPTSQAVVQIFADTEASACNDAYPAPLGETTVTLPASPGLVIVKIPITKSGKNPGKMSSSFTVQIQVPLVAPQGAMVRYDSSTSPSSVTITCLPKVGKKTC